MPPIFRLATRPEIETILDWAAREGWNPGLADAPAFWSADPEGFFLAEEESRPAAALSLVRYGPDYAFLGFYMAHPDFRGQGIGRALWDHALATLGARTTVGLDGVVSQQDNYRKSGFARAHANIRYSGAVALSATSATADLVEVQPLHMPMLIDYDRSFNPARREAFLREWLRPLDGRISIALLRSGSIAGFGTIRQCREGWKIGPLFSDSETGADLLFRALAARAADATVSLDIPEPNAAARALCERYNLKPVFETARMYRGLAPDLPLQKLYGITTFELG